MRADKDVLSALTAWAAADANIRVLLLTGSRANDRATVDVLSDYDVDVVVNSIESFRDNRWLSGFGDVMATIEEERTNALTRLVLFKDGIRIDFQICELEEFHKKALLAPTNNDWDIGVRTLVDKDGIASAIQLPSHTRYTIAKPSREEYDGLIKDFWWDTTYVAKSLWRDELFYAKYMLDSVIRFGYLKTAIDWHIGMNNEWKVNTNKQGREFKRYLDANLWRKLEATFAGANAEENWSALFAMTTLFRSLTADVGKQLNYHGNNDLEQDLTNYLRTIKERKHE